MPNGVAVALHPELESPSASTAVPAKCLSKNIRAGATKSKPGAAPALTEIETRIGDAAAKCAIAISKGIADFAAGGAMTPMTRMLGGEYLAELAQLRIDTFGQIDFAAVAHREGKRSMLRHHGTTLRQLDLDPAALEKALTELIGWAVAISDRVCRDEMALARTMAN